MSHPEAARVRNMLRLDKHCLFILAILLYLLLTGCSPPPGAPSPSDSPTLRTETEKKPLKVALTMLGEFEHKQVRKLSKRVFLNGLRERFEKVDFVSESGDESYDLVFMLHIAGFHENASENRIGIGYVMSVLAPYNPNRFFEGSPFSEYGIVETERFSINKRHLIQKAGRIAFDKLMNKVLSSTTISTYIRAEIEQQQAPPAQLVAEVQFDDSNTLFPNNGQLDAGETGELIVKVSNQGSGPGYGVNLTASADQSEVTLPTSSAELGKIRPGAEREIRLPVRAGLDLPSGGVSLRVGVREKRGYDARAVKLVVPTKHLEKHALSIVDHSVNDGTTGHARGNGNGIPESGETIELSASIRNSGPGPAVATLFAAEVDSGVTIVQRAANLGMIHPHRTARGTIALAIPRTYDRSTLSVSLQVRDNRGEATGNPAVRHVELNVIPRAPSRSQGRR